MPSRAFRPEFFSGQGCFAIHILRPSGSGNQVVPRESPASNICSSPLCPGRLAETSPGPSHSRIRRSSALDAAIPCASGPPDIEPARSPHRELGPPIGTMPRHLVRRPIDLLRQRTFEQQPLGIFVFSVRLRQHGPVSDKALARFSEPPPAPFADPRCNGDRRDQAGKPVICPRTELVARASSRLARPRKNACRVRPPPADAFCDRGPIVPVGIFRL